MVVLGAEQRGLAGTAPRGPELGFTRTASRRFHARRSGSFSTTPGSACWASTTTRCCSRPRAAFWTRARSSAPSTRRTTPTGFRDLDRVASLPGLGATRRGRASRASPRACWPTRTWSWPADAPTPGPLSLTVGMLTMDEEPSVARMIAAIRAHAPDAQILVRGQLGQGRDADHRRATRREGAQTASAPRARSGDGALDVRGGQAERRARLPGLRFHLPSGGHPAIRGILESGVDVVNAARTRRRPRAMPLAELRRQPQLCLDGRGSWTAPRWRICTAACAATVRA